MLLQIQKKFINVRQQKRPLSSQSLLKFLSIPVVMLQYGYRNLELYQKLLFLKYSGITPGATETAGNTVDTRLIESGK